MNCQAVIKSGKNKGKVCGKKICKRHNKVKKIIIVKKPVVEVPVVEVPVVEVPVVEVKVPVIDGDVATEIVLEQVQNMIDEVNTTNKVTLKQIILKTHDTISVKNVLKYVYSDNYVFNIKSTNYKKFLNKKKKPITDGYTNLFKLLDALNDRLITGDNARGHLRFFISKYPNHEELILKIIDKKLKTRMNTATINDVFTGLISNFKAVLANKFDMKHINKGGEWYVSRKLDGVRCLCVITDGKAVFYSRMGKEYTTLGNLRLEIEGIPLDGDYVLDGEVVIMENNNENFKGIMEEIKRKNHTIKDVRFCCFDMLKKEDFYNLSSEETYSVRYQRLLKTFSGLKYLKVLDQCVFTVEKFEELKKEYKANGWEGLMVRLNTGYKGKRTNELLKFKEFLDAEFKVVSIESGIIGSIDKKTGLEKHEEMMSAVILDNGVKCGTGFSQDERRHYFAHPEEIIGCVLTIQYFQVTEDGSLRFPSFKVNHGKKRDT